MHEFVGFLCVYVFVRAWRHCVRLSLSPYPSAVPVRRVQGGPHHPQVHARPTRSVIRQRLLRPTGNGTSDTVRLRQIHRIARVDV